MYSPPGRLQIWDREAPSVGTANPERSRPSKPARSGYPAPRCSLSLRQGLRGTWADSDYRGSMATTLNIDRIWLGNREFEVLAGAVFVVSVGWTGSFTSQDEMLEALAVNAQRTQKLIPVEIRSNTWTKRLYGEAWVTSVNQPWIDKTHVVLTGTGPLGELR